MRGWKGKCPLLVPPEGSCGSPAAGLGSEIRKKENPGGNEEKEWL